MKIARKILFWSLGGIAALICLALIWMSSLPNFAAMLFFYGVFQPLFPSTIDWDDRTAWLKCEGAMADPRKWPPTPYGTCVAMHMCYNEAPLSEAQQKTLEEQMRKLPGCL
jgi:hypothetical protein